MQNINLNIKYINNYKKCFIKETRDINNNITKEVIINKNYINAKNKYELSVYIKLLKSKLDYQYKTYGEVDDYDFNEYCRLINIK